MVLSRVDLGSTVGNEETLSTITDMSQMAIGNLLIDHIEIRLTLKESLASSHCANNIFNAKSKGSSVLVSKVTSTDPFVATVVI
jgi:hypothetical protein